MNRSDGGTRQTIVEPVPSAPPEPSAAHRPIGADLVERLRVLVVAGVATGVVVVGVGSRLAMLLLRVTSPDTVRGVESDDGFTIGEVTLAGSYNLLVLGATVGVIGAAAYRAVAPWLIGPLWFRRVTVAAASGAVVGSMLITADGVDFTLLQPTWLAVATFIVLPALFGWSIGAAVDRVAEADSWTVRGRRRWAVPLILLACFPPTLFAVAVAGAVLIVWVPVSRQIASLRPYPTAFVAVMRSAWFALAVLGLVALVGDIAELA